MSKTRTSFFKDEDKFDYDTRASDRRNAYNKHKEQRMRSALKNKDIKGLMALDYDDEEDDEFA